MSFTGLTAKGNVHPCFPFYKRYKDCVASELVPTKVCGPQVQDYVECISKAKQNAINNKVAHELRKYQILSIPRYNYQSDSFEADNELPDADVFFANK